MKCKLYLSAFKRIFQIRASMVMLVLGSIHNLCARSGWLKFMMPIDCYRLSSTGILLFYKKRNGRDIKKLYLHNIIFVFDVCFVNAFWLLLLN